MHFVTCTGELGLWPPTIMHRKDPWQVHAPLLLYGTHQSIKACRSPSTPFDEGSESHTRNTGTYTSKQKYVRHQDSCRPCALDVSPAKQGMAVWQCLQYVEASQAPVHMKVYDQASLSLVLYAEWKSLKLSLLQI